MSIARITTPGLIAVGISVTLLWGCLIGERLIVRSAASQESQALHEMHVLRQRQRSQPADVPLPRHRGPVRPAES